MKKLLIIGATPYFIEVIKKVKAQDIYTIVTDYTPNAPAKRFADLSYDISTTDIEAVLNIARENKVDGVFVGWSDANLYTAQKICEIMGLPFYATKEQLDYTTNKNLFKQLCRENNVPIVQEYNVDSGLMREGLEYPVIVKPVDNGGSRGISICLNESELITGKNKALRFSRSHQIIVEKYMVGDEVVIYYTVQDGKISLSAMCDRYTNKEQSGVAQLPTAYVFPSKHLKSYVKSVDPQIKNMFKSIGIKNGVIFIQSFVQDSDFYIYEMGYRLNGAQEFKIISEVNNINSLDMMISFSLTGKMSGWDVETFDNPFFEKYCCKLSLLIKPGTIDSIEGIAQILEMPEVIDVKPMYEEGASITSIGTLSQIVLRVFIVADSKQSLADVINRVYDSVQVLDVNGGNMLMSGFDSKLLFV